MRGGLFIDVVMREISLYTTKDLDVKTFLRYFSCLLNSASYDFFKPQYVLEINEFISYFNIFIQKKCTSTFHKKYFAENAFFLIY